MTCPSSPYENRCLRCSMCLVSQRSQEGPSSKPRSSTLAEVSRKQTPGKNLPWVLGERWWGHQKSSQVLQKVGLGCGRSWARVFSKGRWPSSVFLMEVHGLGLVSPHQPVTWLGEGCISASPLGRGQARRGTSQSRENTDCIGYLSLPVIKHQDQGNLSRKSLFWTCHSRGIRVDDIRAGEVRWGSESPGIRHLSGLSCSR